MRIYNRKIGLTAILMAMPFTLSLTALAQSDQKALDLADKVMQAMGGQEAYDNTRYITWRFFGKRLHVWDKFTGNNRLEDGKGLVVVVNTNTKKGKAWQDGEPIEDETLLNEKLKGAYEAWINDSYWVVMPYKLKDPGVTLVYSREDTMENGTPAHVLTMTFTDVGVTPENKYEVFVNKETHLIEQWAFFRNASDEKPGFVLPWSNWTKHGNILLSEDRGKYQHTDLAVLENVPDSVFQDPKPFELNSGE